MGEVSNIEWTGDLWANLHPDNFDAAKAFDEELDRLQSQTGRQLGAQKSAATKCGMPLEEWQVRRALGSQRCWACEQWKLVEEFDIDRSRPGGRAPRCKPCMRFAAKLSTYKITEDQYYALPGADGKCAICEQPNSKPYIDHCHATGKVRGVLCPSCNTAIGLLKDDPDLIGRAINYLKGIVNE